MSSLVNTKKYFLFGALNIILLLICGSPLYAHVKWFSDFSYRDEPLQFADVSNNLFWILFVLSAIVVAVLTFVDKKIEATRWYSNIAAKLSGYEGKTGLIMRVATAVVLLMSWQLGTLIMPDLAINSELLKWSQFFVAVLLIFRVSVPWAGFGMIFLYLTGIYQFGLHHMLDYLLIPGVGYFFATSNSSNPKMKSSGLFLIYITLGFSLCWAGMEKLIYPQWGTYILETYPVLALGLDEKIFVQGAAFIEISVGVMIMFCYLHRILAAVVTLLFFLTTLVFGATEVTGHLLIHASLIVFIIAGSGNIFKVFPSFYRRLGRNPIYAGGGFAILFFVFLFLYTFGANQKYNKTIENLSIEHVENIEISDVNIAPEISFQINEDKLEGWNMEISTKRFNLQAPSDNDNNATNVGYAILSINGEMNARIYSSSFYLPPMEKGTYDVEVILYGESYGQLTHLGMPIKANHEIIVE